MRARRAFLPSMIGFLPMLLILPIDGCGEAPHLRGVAHYHDQCSICHGHDAVAHARRTLKLDGSRVIVSRSGKLLDEFLLTHGRASKREREGLVALFTRLLREGETQ